MELTLALSPCPNDTFIFHALLHGLIDTKGLSFSPSHLDIESLNKRALQHQFDITKLSIPAFNKVKDKYALLDSGAALGHGVGPLLISKDDHMVIDAGTRIAIPGFHTTANYLLSKAYPSANNKIEVLFSEIEDAVLSGKAEAGLIIHENRFTYQKKGLKKIKDLGEWWEEKTELPIPLGCLAMKKSYSSELILKIEKLIAQSIQYAFDHPDAGKEYIETHAQGMESEVLRQHIDLYVNRYSLSLGEKGKDAIDYFCSDPVIH